MDAVIQHLIKGQEKLEWALERQMSSAQADRDVFKNTITAQMEGLQKMVTDPGTPILREPRGTPYGPSGISLQKYVPGEDPDAFMLNFERASRARGWPEEKWLFCLAPLLTGEAQAAYQVASASGNTPYAEFKEVILDHLGLDVEAYRVRFRKERWLPGENPKTLFFRLKMAADKWLQPASSTKEDIMNKVYLEQFLEALLYGTQRWLKQHPHLTPEQAVELATTYSHAQPRTCGWDPEKTSKAVVPKPERKQKVITEYPKLRPIKTDIPNLRGPQCFECGDWGHIARACPSRKPAEEPMEVGYVPKSVLYTAELGSSFHVSVRVNRRVVNALLDSGCRQSVAQKTLVHTSQYVPDTLIHIRCVHGDIRPYPLAIITLTPVGGNAYSVRVGVVEGLPEELIQGTDNPEFLAMFRNTLRSKEVGPKERGIGHVPQSALTTPEPWLLDRRFHFAQSNDATLVNAWDAAHINQNNASPTYPGFLIQDNLLYRKVGPEDPLQLLVPQTFREQIIFFSHSHLTAGHVGAEKTTQNVLRHFYWPGIYNDIKSYCQTCEICQKKNLQRPPRPFATVTDRGHPVRTSWDGFDRAPTHYSEG